MSAPPSTIDSGRRFVPQLLVSFIAALSLVLGPLAFAPAQAATFSISGTVHGQGVGALDQASVELQVYDEQDDYFQTTDSLRTLEDGSYQFDAVEAGQTYRLRVDRVGSLARYTGAQFVLNADKVVSRITLVNGGSIAGTVKESGTNALVPDASVMAYRVVGNSYDYDDNYWAEVDADTGAFTVDGLAAGDYLLKFSDYDEKYVTEFYDNAAVAESAKPVTVVQDATTPLGTVTLELGASFSGNIKNTANTQLDYVQIAALRMVDGKADYENAFGARFDETTGDYTIPGLPAGDYKIHFSAYQYFEQFYNDKASEVTADVITVVGGESKPLDPTILEKEASISGSIEDAAGKPLYDMGVEAFLVTGGVTAPESSAWAYTESDGSYELRALHAGTYRLRYFDGLHVYADKAGPVVDVAEGDVIRLPGTVMVKKPVVKPPVVKPVPKKAASIKVSAKGGKKKATLTITVKASGVTPTGKITVKLGSKKLKTVTLKRGKATVKLTKQKKGKRAYKIIYSGDRKVNAKTVTSKKVTIK